MLAGRGEQRLLTVGLTHHEANSLGQVGSGSAERRRYELEAIP